MSYHNSLVVGYLAFTSSDHIVFQPVTPRAHEAFSGLPLDKHGAYHAANDEEANTLFERPDAQGLADFTTV